MNKDKRTLDEVGKDFINKIKDLNRINYFNKNLKNTLKQFEICIDRCYSQEYWDDNGFTRPRYFNNEYDKNLLLIGGLYQGVFPHKEELKNLSSEYVLRDPLIDQMLEYMRMYEEDIVPFLELEEMGKQVEDGGRVSTQQTTPTPQPKKAKGQTGEFNKDLFLNCVPVAVKRELEKKKVDLGEYIETNLLTTNGKKFTALAALLYNGKITQENNKSVDILSNEYRKPTSFKKWVDVFSGICGVNVTFYKQCSVKREISSLKDTFYFINNP